MKTLDGALGCRCRVLFSSALVLGILASTNAFPTTDSSSAASAGPGPDLATPVKSVRTGPLRDMPPIPPRAARESRAADPSRPEPPAGTADRSAANSVFLHAVPGPVAFAPGLAGSRTTGDPDDVDGRVGPTQYVQWDDTAFAVFDRTTGALLYGPAAGNTLFQPLGGACAAPTGGACAAPTGGAPKVAYDDLTGRWTLSRFVVGATPNGPHRCVAVSATEDATGAYDLYDFAADSTSDPDAFDGARSIRGSTARTQPVSRRTGSAAPLQCTPGSCDDNDVCTVDTCDPLTGCIYTPVSCDDGNVCTVDSCSPTGGPGVATLFLGHDTSQLERQYQKIGTFIQTWGTITDATGAAVDASGVVYICNPAYGANVIERRGPGDTNLGTITATVNGQFIEDLGNFGGGFILAGTFEGDVYTINTTTGAHTLLFSTGQTFIGVTYDGTHIWTTGGYTTTLVSKRTLSGTVVATFDTGRMNAGIGYDPDDGTLWIGHFNGQVTHYSQLGTLLGGFSTAAGGQLVDGVELAKLELAPGCQHNAVDCNDNDFCTIDACDPVTGCSHAPYSCDDLNPCTDDVCDSGAGCIHTNNTAACEDSDACTTGDTCSGGLCLPGAPVICNDNNACTTDSCDPRTGCAFVNDTNYCDDGNACTIEDICIGGTCTAGVPVVCNDNNACTMDSCIPPTGCVYTSQPNGSACDDGNACTTGDVCVGGACLGAPVVCQSPPPCYVAGGCDPLTGTCTNSPAPNGTACNDGNPCTLGDVCIGGVCAGGVVIGVPAEIQNLTVAADKSTLIWSPASDATAYQVVRGAVDALPVGSSAVGEACFESLPAPAFVDPATPELRAGFWYLPQARNPCGPGPLGTQSNGTARVTPACP